MGKIKLAIAGVGNCASSLIQGLFYYKNITSNSTSVPGLMHNVLGDYQIRDIQPVVAFDIDSRKVGKDLGEAIFSLPNCTQPICQDIPNLNAPVLMGHPLDGLSKHMADYPVDNTFSLSDQKPVDVVKELENSGAEILLNYLPVGSDEATRFYARAALKAGCAFINCVPVFVSSDPGLANQFTEAGLPMVGDDIKSQVGATIVHRTLARLFEERGVKITSSYQLNVGGNTDFLNMLARERLKSKKISKTQAVQSNLSESINPTDLHISPSDHVSWLKDKKLCFLRIEGRKFGNIPINMEIRLDVEDSPNSAGVVIDAIRCAKIALDREIGGPLLGPSAYFMKSPPQQHPDPIARQMVEQFISGTRKQ